jgi:hypothetical protein
MARPLPGAPGWRLRLQPLTGGGFLPGRTKVSLDGGNEEFPELRLCRRSSSATRAVSRSTVASNRAIVSRWASIVSICWTMSEANSSYDGRRSGVLGTRRSSHPAGCRSRQHDHALLNAYLFLDHQIRR